ncbi:hypothetical protein D9615_002960 [Tricholomella constricta]|uniref:Adhesion regulating molecule n=1 Tax=Tricholomella constricta TaxID=117010 RepID=A0A8H5HFJ5_9AGAR|nr:hypothetical protein D9615_002960 [Tricholomella constricta]
MSETLLAFKAGRAFRRPGTNFIDPRPEKGAITLTNGEDGLLHFTWKDRTSGNVEEDLILFPSDASFVKVSEATGGRVYVLKFSSSDQRHFFWMQDASSARDDEFVDNVNGLLDDPEYTLQWGTTSTQPQASTSAQASSSAPPAFQATPEQLAQLEALLQSAGGQTQASPPDILTPTNLTPLFASHPELIPTLFPHLPPDLPVPPSTEVLGQIINSPQFRSALASFDQALRTGLLGGLVRGLGLPEEAGTGIGPFLNAIQEQAERGGDSMETD